MLHPRYLYGAFFIALLAALTALHFYPFDLNTWHLIDYDDNRFIVPMLTLDLKAYFLQWLPQPDNYAFPLRDITFFLDQWAGGTLGFPLFYISNFIIFFITLLAFERFLGLAVRLPSSLRFVIVALLAFHPLNVELVQWASARKNIMPPLFVVLGNLIVFKGLLEGRALTRRQWLGLLLLHAASLSCYPTSVLWLPWVLATQYRYMSRARFWRLLALTGLASLAYLRFAAPSGSEFESSFTVLFTETERVVYFFVRSLGRGFFNMLYPDQLVIYYDQENWRNFVGFGLLLAYLWLAVVWLRGVTLHADKKLLLALASLTLILALPQGHVFLSFPDFRWSDRYNYIITPYFLIFNTLLLQKSTRTQQLWHRWVHKIPIPLASLLVLAAAALIITTYAVKSRQLIPHWRDAVGLAEACVQGEESPKCLAAMMSAYFAQDCGRARPYIERSYQRYQEHKPRHSSQFLMELPFYDSTCVALMANQSPTDKLASRSILATRYPGSPGLVFGLTLMHLEANQADAAWNLAKTYYLSPGGLPITTTRHLYEIYVGHTRALCEILSSDECWANRNGLLSIHRLPTEDAPMIQWGYGVTKIMYERRLMW